MWNFYPHRIGGETMWTKKGYIDNKSQWYIESCND